jgi:chaperonin cofactor prefoldin
MIKMTNKKWVIKYKDVKVHHHRHEVLHEDGEWYGEVGDIMTFQTKEKAQKFLNTLDSKEYDRWIEVEK